MKRNLLLAVTLITLASACKKAEDKAIDTTPSTADTTAVKEETPAPAMDSATVAKAWEDYMTPGEAHKMLALDNGMWNVEVTWFDPETGQGQKGTMTAESKMIMGGRYQQTTHKGTFMGMPFEGIATVGHDNASGKMVSTWIDNMGTGMMYMRGDYDPSTKTIEFRGEMTDPITKKSKPAREIFAIADANTRKMEMFDVGPDGKEYKSMEIVMKRK